jgi:hypothetical protein
MPKSNAGCSQSAYYKWRRGVSNWNPECPLESIYRRVWITRGARFSASRRLSKENHRSLFFIAFLSIFTIAINILFLFPSFQCDQVQSDYSSIFTIIVSIIIVAISFSEASKNYSTRAQDLFSCANELSQLYFEIDIDIKSKYDLQKRIDLSVKYTKMYHEIIKSHFENHDPVDVFTFNAEHRKESGVGVARYLKYYPVIFWLNMKFSILYLSIVALYFYGFLCLKSGSNCYIVKLLG